MASPGEERGDGPPEVVWCGNIPHYLSEDELLHELAAYNVRPSKAVLRNRKFGEDLLYIYIIFVVLLL